MKTTHRGPLVTIEHHVKQRASWKTYGEGLASIRIDSHVERKHLSITVEETHLASRLYDEKRDVTKAASIALDETEALALFKALEAHFKPRPQEGLAAELSRLAGEDYHPLRDAHLESALLHAYRAGQLVTIGEVAELEGALKGLGQYTGAAGEEARAELARIRGQA